MFQRLLKRKWLMANIERQNSIEHAGVLEQFVIAETLHSITFSFPSSVSYVIMGGGNARTLLKTFININQDIDLSTGASIVYCEKREPGFIYKPQTNDKHKEREKHNGIRGQYGRDDRTSQGNRMLPEAE